MEKVIEFIHELYDSMRLYFENNDYIGESKLRLFINEYNTLHGSEIEYHSGINRHAIVLEDYVVKFDLRDTTESYFGGCEREAKGYEFACEHDMEYLFAPVTKYDYKGKTFYIMPRVEYVNEELDDSVLFEELSDEERNFLENYFDDLHSGNFGFNAFGEVKIFDYACFFKDGVQTFKA